MPNYDYDCVKCNTTVERNVPTNERESQRCDACSEPMIRKWSFKGSVWSPTKNGGMS